MSDEDYLKRVIEEDRQSSSENYSKLQEEVNQSMIKWRNIFDEKVTEMLSTRVKKIMSSKDFISAANLEIIQQVAEDMKEKTVKGLESTERFGYTNEDRLESMEKINEIFQAYIIEYQEDFQKRADAHFESALAALTDWTGYTKLREHLVKSHCDIIDERLQSFKRTTKYADDCFAAFVETTNKRSSEIVDDEKIERRRRLRESKLREKQDVFERTLEDVSEFNREFIEKLANICLPCSVMKNRFEELEEGCENS